MSSSFIVSPRVGDFMCLLMDTFIVIYARGKRLEDHLLYSFMLVFYLFLAEICYHVLYLCL